eukprot:12790743-Alexandrium_andersonii.AAC.1
MDSRSFEASNVALGHTTALSESNAGQCRDRCTQLFLCCLQKTHAIVLRIHVAVHAGGKGAKHVRALRSNA